MPSDIASCARIICCDEAAAVAIRPFDVSSPIECEAVSALIQANYLQRPDYISYPKEYIQLYLDANTPDGLKDAMSKPYTMGYVATVAHKIVGIVIGRYLLASDGKPVDLQIRRLHTAIDANNIRGVGKALLAACEMRATADKVHTLSTTATWPAKSFFEHMRWQGQQVNTHYHCKTLQRDVCLPQFCATYNIPH